MEFLSESYKKRLQFLAGITEGKEIEDINSRTKLAVFDFDGTLVDTPKPDGGKQEWEAKTGREWEGGWFSNPESLNMNVFDLKTIPDVISDYKREWSDPNTLVIMLTGRIPSMDKYVRAVLDSHGLKFDDYLYNDGGETSDNKMKHIEQILKYNPSIDEVEMWDDRTPHIPDFREWGEGLVKSCHHTVWNTSAGCISKFHINHVPGFEEL